MTDYSIGLRPLGMSLVMSRRIKIDLATFDYRNLLTHIALAFLLEIGKRQRSTFLPSAAVARVQIESMRV